MQENIKTSCFSISAKRTKGTDKCFHLIILHTVLVTLTPFAPFLISFITYEVPLSEIGVTVVKSVKIWVLT